VRVSYQSTSIDADNEVEPRLKKDIRVRIPQDLKACNTLLVTSLAMWFAIKATDEAIERPKHD
jgi:hypothetical protein